MAPSFRAFSLFLSLGSRVGISSCESSDNRLRAGHNSICASLGPDEEGCPYPPNTTVFYDWPNQAIYFKSVLNDLADPSTCLNTSIAASTVGWLNDYETNVSDTDSFLNAWRVFQVQYYDMPRLPGERIEAAGTLGRKCWAFAYLAQGWDPVQLQSRLAAANLSADTLIGAYVESIAVTLPLCNDVLANCFINASYDPRRNGSCPVNVSEFHVGFQLENAKRGFQVMYPFRP